MSAFRQVCLIATHRSNNNSSRKKVAESITTDRTAPLSSRQDDDLEKDHKSRSGKETHHRLPQRNSLRTRPNRVAGVLDIYAGDVLSIRREQRGSDSELGVRAYVIQSARANL